MKAPRVDVSVLKSENVLICNFCHGLFKDYKSNHRKFCCSKCFSKSRALGIRPKCLDCGKQLSRLHLKRCMSCYNKSIKGSRHWNWKGGKRKCLDCGKQLASYRVGRCSKCFVPLKSGEKSPNWKGGVTPLHNKIRSSIENKLWIQSVFARDGYTCQKTGKRGGDLTAHHILNFAQYPELRFAIDNGITLSIKSHKEFHKKYGIKSNTREQLLEFLEQESRT